MLPLPCRRRASHHSPHSALQEVYSSDDNRGVFDCVVTCFFIDTAHNIVEYLEIIHHCLRKGGAWINLGPLLYHW